MDNQIGPRSIHHIRESVIPLSLQIFAALFLVSTFYGMLLVYVLLPSINIFTDDPITALIFLWGACVVAFVLELIAVLQITLTWGTTNYYITSHHLIRTRGIMVASEDVYDLYNLRSVRIDEGILGRVFNYGNIHLVVAASGYHDEMKIIGIANPKQYERIFRRFLEEAKQPIAHDEIDIHALVHPPEA